jgi:hypothetical protein
MRSLPSFVLHPLSPISAPRVRTFAMRPISENVGDKRAVLIRQNTSGKAVLPLAHSPLRWRSTSLHLETVTDVSRSCRFKRNRLQSSASYADQRSTDLAVALSSRRSCYFLLLTIIDLVNNVLKFSWGKKGNGGGIISKRNLFRSRLNRRD